MTNEDIAELQAENTRLQVRVARLLDENKQLDSQVLQAVERLARAESQVDTLMEVARCLAERG